jgi:hypothetical protein
LIKRLLEKDVTKRYGNMKNGIYDIKGHRFFNDVNWSSLLNKEEKPHYVPEIK